MITIRLYPRSGGGLGSAMRFILRLLEIKDKVRLVKLNDDDGKLETLKTIFLIPDSKLEIVHDSNEIESILKQEQIIWDENFMRDISHNSFTTKDNKYFPDKKDLANYHRRIDLYNRYKLIFPDDIASYFSENIIFDKFLYNDKIYKTGQNRLNKVVFFACYPGQVHSYRENDLTKDIGAIAKLDNYKNLIDVPKLWPMTKLYPIEFWSKLFEKFKLMGYDVINLDSVSLNIETKILILSKCSLVIGYEGGIHHLAHVMGIPSIILPHRKISSGNFWTFGASMMFLVHAMHKNTRTYMLEDENKLLEMPENDIHLLVDDLYNDKNYKNLYYQFSELFSHEVINEDRLSFSIKNPKAVGSTNYDVFDSSHVRRVNRCSMDFLFDLYDE